jgi:hypothetical protein
MSRNKQNFSFIHFQATTKIIIVHQITCKCGYTHQFAPPSYCKTFQDGDVWECPECHAKARFKYQGWTLEEYNG